MKKKSIVGIVVSGGMLLGSMAGASAAVTEPGTPGERNCQGQTTAYLAQVAGPNGDLSFLNAPGIGNVADLLGISVQEVKEIIRVYCAQ